MLWNLKYFLPDFNRRAPNPVNGSQDIGMLNCRGIFDNSNGLARGEAIKLWRELRDRKCLIKSTYTVLILITLQWFVRLYEADRHRCDNYESSYSATNGQQGKCVHFQNALNSASYFYPICFNFIRIM